MGEKARETVGKCQETVRFVNKNLLNKRLIECVVNVTFAQ